jgi:hypothetical protein
MGGDPMRYDSSTPLLRTAAFCAAVLTLLLFAGRVTAAAADTTYLTQQGAKNPSSLCPYSITFNGYITGPGNSSVTYYYTRFAGKATYSTPVTITIPASGTTQGTSLIPPSQITVDSSTVGLQSYELDIQSPPGSDSTSYGKVYFNAQCGLLMSTMPPIPVASPSPFSLKNQVTHGALVSNAKVLLHLVTSTNRSKTLMAVLNGVDNFVGCGANNTQDLPCVGYSHFKDQDPLDVRIINIYRNYLMFAKIPPGSNVVKAVLGLTATDATSLHCFGGIGPAVAPWTTNNNFVDGDFGFPAPAQFNGAYVSIDVTSIVKAWATGKLANNGFVMRGSNEQNFLTKTESCEAVFSKPNVLYLTTVTPIMAP